MQDFVAVLEDGLIERDVEGGFVYVAVGVGGEDGDLSDAILLREGLAESAYHLTGATIYKGDGGDDLQDFEWLHWKVTRGRRDCALLGCLFLS